MLARNAYEIMRNDFGVVLKKPRNGKRQPERKRRVLFGKGRNCGTSAERYALLNDQTEYTKSTLRATGTGSNFSLIRTG